jgi:hypothetical protein
MPGVVNSAWEREREIRKHTMIILWQSDNNIGANSSSGWIISSSKFKNSMMSAHTFTSLHFTSLWSLAFGPHFLRSCFFMLQNMYPLLLLFLKQRKIEWQLFLHNLMKEFGSVGSRYVWCRSGNSPPAQPSIGSMLWLKVADEPPTELTFGFYHGDLTLVTYLVTKIMASW